MIRAVLDTNVFLSALRSQDGASFQIVDRLERGEFTRVLSQTVLAEYDEVLNRGQEGAYLGRSNGRLGGMRALLDMVPHAPPMSGDEP
jgi:putative PIN family toxin of toxin-antitoxin system